MTNVEKKVRDKIGRLSFSDSPQIAPEKKWDKGKFIRLAEKAKAVYVSRDEENKNQTGDNWGNS